MLLLDADVIIDLHSIGLFEKMAKAYDIRITLRVFKEAKYYFKGRKRIPINIRHKVAIIENVDIGCLRKVFLEAQEARLTIDKGEATSIAYIIQDKEDITFCACDKAAIKLMSYMGLDRKSVSVETALRTAGHHRKLYQRHLESTFKNCINDGKALRVQFKKLM